MKSKRKYIIVALITTLVLLFTLSALTLTACEPNREPPPPYENNLRAVGYLPDWSYRAYENIDLTALTHINIAFCNVNNNGEFSCGIPDNDLYEIVDRAHESGVAVIVALGGGGQSDPYRALTSEESKILALDVKLTAFCEKYGLDGVDLDVEIGSGDSFWNNYDMWVSDLRGICDDRGWTLSTATAPWVADTVTAETFAKFDFINVMAYDDDTRGRSSHASYDFALYCLDYYSVRKGIPADKLVLGVPFYGRGYSANGSLDWNSYESFSDLIADDPDNYNKDEYNGIAYNGAPTMRKKCELARDYGGIMIWEITLDASGEYSLLSVIGEEITHYVPQAELE